MILNNLYFKIFHLHCIEKNGNLFKIEFDETLSYLCQYLCGLSNI